MDYPLVTIGIPYYKAANYIVETLESVKQQIYTNIELILVNDCSPDNSHGIVEEWLQKNSSYFTNVIHLSNSYNCGVAYSSRVLQKAAKGVYFSKLDADDLILPPKILEQVDFLENYPETALVYSNTLLIDANGTQLSEDYFSKQKFSTVHNNKGPTGKVFYELIIEDFIPSSSVLLRKHVLDAVGGYDETLYIEDWDMWLRIAKEHQIGFMEGFYSLYRIHSESMMQKRASLINVYRSLITTLSKHKGISSNLDKVLAKHLYTYTIGLYRYGVIDAELLLTNLKCNKDTRSLLYYVAGLLRIRVNQKH